MFFVSTVLQTRHCGAITSHLIASPSVSTRTADKALRYDYDDTTVVQRVYGSACYITDSFPRCVCCNHLTSAVLQ